VTSGKRYWADGTAVAGEQFGYAFDTIGNRTQTQTGGDTNGLNLRVANYTVNSLNQITQRDVPGTNDVAGAALLGTNVTVNGVAVVDRKAEFFHGTVGTNNAPGAAWLPVTVTGAGNSTAGHLYVAQEPEQFAYDADGNLTNDGRWAYTWDAENRLIGMTNSTGVGPLYNLSFAYDSKGRRIQKIISTNSVTFTTNTFLYDGWNLIAEVGTSGSLVRSYVWGTDLSGSAQGAGGVGGLLAIGYHGTATTNAFVAYDGNGNVTALINAGDGTLLANYDYGPFGEVIRATGPARGTNPFRFSTKYQDDESDLLYYGRRYYKPSTGTWLNRDPMEESGGQNLYEFALNNSINLFDTDGKVPTSSPPPASSTPKTITRYLMSTTIYNLALWTRPDLEWKLQVKDATGTPVVGAAVVETVTLVSQHCLFDPLGIITGSATTRPSGIFFDTYAATFWKCCPAPYIRVHQDIVIGSVKATFLTMYGPSGFIFGNLRATFH